jgi:hypothetical protein
MKITLQERQCSILLDVLGRVKTFDKVMNPSHFVGGQNGSGRRF